MVMSLRTKNRLAVFILYNVGQNEPSKPSPQLISIPDDEAERDKFLTELYRDQTGQPDAEVTVKIATDDWVSKYCDLLVSDAFGDVCMLVTFVKMPES